MSKNWLKVKVRVRVRIGFRFHNFTIRSHFTDKGLTYVM